VEAINAAATATEAYTVSERRRHQHRGVVIAGNGMMATGHPLASATGLRVLMDGGNAIDAAFAAAAVLGVVQPMMSGLGGDSFLLYYHRATRRIWAVNGSGPAPRALSLDYIRDHARGVLPARGMLSAGVPGSVDVMCTALEQWGSGGLDLGDILAPAIRYAEEGAPVAEAVAGVWASERDVLALFDSSRNAFLNRGNAYQAGERFSAPDYGCSLRLIAGAGRDTFYGGELGARIAAYSRAHGGLLREEDLAAYHCEIYEPITTTYRDCTVYSTAPPSQGAILLEMLNLVEGYELSAFPWADAQAIHLMVEAKKLAFADRNAYLADPHFHANPLSTLLDKRYAMRRRQAIQADASMVTVPPGAPAEALGDTTSLCVADRDGNMVSLITSLSAAFGCAEVIDGTGILLNNRVGRGFTTDETSPNVLAPGKRTMHTLHCYLVVRNGEPYLAGGTPGGDGQPQINLQVLTNMLDWRMNVQEAIEAPRWVSFPGTDPTTIPAPFELRLEPGIGDEVMVQLQRLGHRIAAERTSLAGCAAQVIELDATRGMFHGGSDPRMDGCAMGY
jgi:gamma-glutamyltranspeptidase / glutathione hydrolase